MKPCPQCREPMPDYLLRRGFCGNSACSGYDAMVADIQAEYAKPTPSDLPKRIIVDQNGHYWRDFGDSLSMCPTTEANEDTQIVAVFVPDHRREIE